MMYRTSLLVLAAMASISAADPKPRRVDVAVTKQGFEPDHVTLHKDEPVMLAFTRKTDATCAKSIVVDVGDGKRVTKPLPLDTTVEVALTPHKAGELHYACAMDMLHGVLTIQ